MHDRWYPPPWDRNKEPEPPDYEKAQNFGTFHYSCNTCGALVKDRTLHTAWHHAKR
jgi:hypothetical protein